MSDEDEAPSLGELLRQSRNERSERARKASTLARVSYATAPESQRGKKQKKGPREISSRRPVPAGRFDCLGIDTSNTKRNFDPRFEDHCGELREDHTDRNFAFVDSLREKERAELEHAAERAPDDEELQAQLRRIRAQTSRRKAYMRRKKIHEEARTAEKAAVREGKTPYFMKRSELRERELEAKFTELKATGGVQKFIAKRRRRAVAKDRRRLPARRTESDTHGGGAAF